MFDPSTSDLAGVAPATLQLWLGQAQQALHELSIGAKAVTVSYAQGEGSKSVTFTPASVPQLRAHIAALMAQLGMTTRARRPVRFRF